MHSFRILSPMLLLALVLLAPFALAATHKVKVGPNGRLVYDPPYVHAHPGDTIKFIFQPKNHTVTQSSFKKPCTAIPGGIDSGFMPVEPNSDHPPSFKIHVKDRKPAWFFCRQDNHCGQGMVFAINPGPANSPKSYDNFRKRALAQSGSDTNDYNHPNVYVRADPVDHKILVGENGTLSYNPPNISAAVGDTVTFEFKSKNHTATQSSFAYPCVRSGFDSGFQPISKDTSKVPTYTIKINDTKTIFGYCGQGSNCGSGMVFAINAVESNGQGFSAFRNRATKTNSTSGHNGGSSGHSDRNVATMASSVTGSMMSGLMMVMLAMML